MIDLVTRLAVTAWAPNPTDRARPTNAAARPAFSAPDRETSASPTTAIAVPANGRTQSNGVVIARLDSRPSTAAATASLLTGR